MFFHQLFPKHPLKTPIKQQKLLRDHHRKKSNGKESSDDF
jgi:hypothetical protein